MRALLLLCFFATAACAQTPALQPVVLKPEATDRVLLNPGMGVYLGMTLDVPPDAWYLPIMDIAYCRADWGKWEPNGPNDDLAKVFDPYFDLWVKQLGKRVAFRAMAANMHSRSEYVTPKWVFDSGVPSVEHVGLYVPRQTDPVFWDDRYVEQMCGFIRRLGKALDGRPGLEFVDCGLIGDWGEMHLGTFLPGRWTRAQLDTTGFTQEKYIAAYRRMIDAYAEAFPHTRVFLNIRDVPQIHDYAAIRGLHFRYDGLGPQPMEARLAEDSFRPYAARGVMTNLEYADDYWTAKGKDPDMLAKSTAMALSVPMSYLHSNLLMGSQMDKAPPEVRQTLTDLAHRIGYRFGVEQVATVGPFRCTGREIRLPLTLTWRNRGVAWCHDSYALELAAFADGAAAPAARSLLYPNPPTTRWAPGATAEVPALFTMPATMKPGRYALAVRMVQPQLPGRPIQLDLPSLGVPEEGWHRLGEIEGVAAAGTAVAYAESFATDGHGWQARPGIVLARAEGRNGGAALRLAGTQPSSWVVGGTQVAISPGARYRLSLWMRVDKTDPPGAKLCVRCGLHRADGSFIANEGTKSYDAAQGGWQELTVEFDAPVDATRLELYVGKPAPKPLTVDVTIAEVRLEELAGP